ncbi:DUF4232 domain-containing protein [Streptomyces aureocirculatus]|uniref:DUF4232 domain-containing protein n=1 Tax=Streptomyces aureocirculatus TaxID=67275 RepID=UPI000691CBAA|nr:DUF4232 domain-containing protein [Streptomyces aureocirculatus]
MTPLAPRHAVALCALVLLAAGCGSGGSGRDDAGGPATRVAGQGGLPPSAGPTTPSFEVTPDKLEPDDLDSGAPRYGVPSAAAEIPDRPAEASRDCSGRSGLLVEPGPVDAAMGLRAMTVTATHCGTGTYRLDGYPDLRALDGDREPLDVRPLKGTEQITTGVPDPGPHPVRLGRGESATVAVVWRNTYTDTRNPAVLAPHLRVVAAPGAPARTITPHGGIDVGSTGRIGTTAWKKLTRDRWAVSRGGSPG